MIDKRRKDLLAGIMAIFRCYIRLIQSYVKLRANLTTRAFGDIEKLNEFLIAPSFKPLRPVK